MFGTADEGRALFKKPKQPVGFLGNANPNACSPHSRAADGGPNPQRPRTAKIGPIQPSVNLKRGGEPTRSACQVRDFSGSSTTHHEVNPIDRLHRSQENTGADAFRFRRDIQCEPAAVNKVNVRVATFQKEGPVARRLPAKGMRRSVPDQICFGFDNPTAESATGGKVMDERLPEEKPCQLGRVVWKLRAPQPARG